MVVLTVQVDGDDRNLYMDNGLYEQLTRVVKPYVQKKDFDYVLAVDGEEGSGKSVFTFQIAKVLDPNFDLSQVCFSPQQFISAVTKARKHSCIVFDEAFTGLSSRASLSEVNQLLVSLMMEMRQKNLYIIIVMPSIFMLERYVALHRAKGLLHLYMRDGKRGYWGFYNRERVKRLWVKGKRFMEYSSEKYRIFGRFQDQYMVNEQEYRGKKTLSLHNKGFRTRAQVYKAQRDALIYAIHKELNKSQMNISKMCSKWGFNISQKNISNIIVERSRELLKDE